MTIFLLQYKKLTVFLESNFKQFVAQSELQLSAILILIYYNIVSPLLHSCVKLCLQQFLTVVFTFSLNFTKLVFLRSHVVYRNICWV